MKILFIAPLTKGSITEERAKVLESLNNTVICFDLQRYYDMLKNPISRRLAFKFNLSNVINKMNHSLQNFIMSQDYDIAIINKGITISPDTVDKIKNEANLHYVVHYSADPTLITHKSRYFVKSIPKYNLCVTTKKYELDLYQKYNPINYKFIEQGYDLEFPEKARKYKTENGGFIYDVVFIGRAEKHYIKALCSILKVTKNVAIWGPWSKAVKNNPELAKYWKGKSVFGDDYIYSLCQGKIDLCLLCKIHPDQVTTRTFEIPATESFMLAERTAEHEKLYEDGKEAVFFDSYEDLQQKVKYYLSHGSEREAIAKAGLERLIVSNYSNRDRMKELLKIVADDLNSENTRC